MVVSKRTVVTNFKKELIEHLDTQFSTFLMETSDLEFYALAVEFNAHSGEVVASMNTEFDFHRKRHYYEQSQEKEINDDMLKFTIEDWNYQAIASIVPVEQALLQHYYNEKPKQLMDMITNTILDFTETEIYQNIPKSEDFILLCKEKNEPLNHAKERLEILKHKRA